MLTQTIQHIPFWVFILFAALVYLGISRTRQRAVPVRRLLTMPLAIAAYSLYGVYSAFGGGAQAVTGLDSVLAMGLLAWLIAAGAALLVMYQLGPRRDVTYLPQAQQFLVPGSWLPLARLMGIFVIKFGIAFALATQAALHSSAPFALSTGMLSGALSGTLVGAAWRIWRVMLVHEARLGSLSPADLYAGK